MGFLSEKKHDRAIVGIDLGTTNTVAAVMRGSEPIVVRSESGSATVPSIVHLGKPELVGERARPFLESDPKNTVFASKRLIGRKYADPEIQDFLKAVPFTTTASCNGDVWIKTDSGRFSPSQIGAKILGHVKKLTEKFLGTEVLRAVITVPAYFDDCQKQATRDAGRIAGLEVVRIINEPTAAALAYGLDKRASGHVAVYDLGGGTFDVSILELADGIFRVKATNGHTFLGGEDFDSEFAHFIAGQFEQSEGVTVCPESFSRLRRAAEEAKKLLSTATQARVYLEDFQDGLDLDVKVTREQLEAVVMKLAQKTVEPCRQAIADAGLKRGDVKHVVLVGGMTRMPAIRRLAAEVFGGSLETGLDPDEAVALGAAVQAGVLAGKIDNVLLLDVAPLSLGIEVAGGIFSRVVDRNTTLPFKRTETFTTSLDNQEHVDIRVFQGERPMVADNRLLGSIRLINLPKMPRGVPKIEVTFEADANGITKVSARDAATGKQQELVVSPASGLTETQVQKMIKEAEENAAADARSAELAEFRENTMRLLSEWEARPLPRDVVEKLDELRGLLQTDVERARQVLEGLQAVL